MTEQELRALVREAIARHAGAQAGSRDQKASGGRQAALPQPVASRQHASHGVFPLSRGSDDDGLCVIEPTVRCNHCGYCLSYGH